MNFFDRVSAIFAVQKPNAPTSDVYYKYCDRFLSAPITAALSFTPLTPNMATLSMFFLGFMGALYFSFGSAIDFIFGGLCFASFLTLSRLWKIRTLDILFCGSVVNAAIYLPIWYTFLPSGFATTETSLVVLQSIYQGLLPNLIGLVFIAHAAKTAGADITAAFMAVVPGFGALLGVILLSEQMPLSSLAALVGLTIGLLLMALKLPSYFPFHRRS